jgi:hypothetical protein
LTPDTLGTSSKLQALDEIMVQFFTASQSFVEEQWISTIIVLAQFANQPMPPPWVTDQI